MAADLLRVKAGVFRVGQDVWNMNHSAFEYGSADYAASIDRYAILQIVFLKFRRKAITCRDAVDLGIR